MGLKFNFKSVKTGDSP